jgi:para-aminobenzoate synthetase/4-amino-4-deoxychorismate lyase
MTTYTQLPTRYHSLVAASAGSVLLQSSRCDAENYRSYLFLRPQRILSASSALFEQIEIALAQGCYVAGFLAYECGEGLEALGDNSAQNSLLPKVWFGVYSHAFVFDHRTGEFEGASPEDFFADKSLFADDSEPSQSPVPQHSAPQPVAIEHLHFGLSEQEYAAKIDAIHEYIRAGDTYQVNFTDALRFDLAGSPDELFSALIASQPVPYSAFLHGDGWRILSFSPELFFRVAGRSILTRPMKGTARRGMDGVEDEAIAQWLAADLKNRSENVMIVDLLRNDLGRLCEFGSVRVDQLCAVERYETLFQMTSQISGTLRSGVRPRDLFASLFPCGSITGAPKHRTMQIIHELERGPRGVYTGAIGFFSPQREAVFSVPIRTVVLEGQSGTMGVGSGIVIDSQADDEFRESLLKSEFLTQREESFQLIESLLWQDGYPLLALHLERLESSARYFGFAFERSAILSALDATARQLSGARSKVRLLLDRTGAISVTHSLVAESKGPGKIKISDLRVASTDRFLRHKTTRRRLYEQQYEQARREGFDEVLFRNEHGELTEGAISNLFIEKDGQWLSPPLSCGLLPGVYRRHLLETLPHATERVLRMEDLASADAIYLCNAVRGCRKATLV